MINHATLKLNYMINAKCSIQQQSVLKEELIIKAQIAHIGNTNFKITFFLNKRISIIFLFYSQGC